MLQCSMCVVVECLRPCTSVHVCVCAYACLYMDENLKTQGLTVG